MYSTPFLSILLLIFYVPLVKTIINYIGSNTQMSGSTYYSMQVSIKHSACLKYTNNTSYAWVQFIGVKPNLQKITFFAPTTKIRTTTLNNDFKNGQFILFNNSMSYLFSKGFTANRIIYKTTVTTSIILDIVFGATYMDYFMVLSEMINSIPTYSLVYIKDKTVKSRTTLNVSITTTPYVKILYKNSTVFMHFVNYLAIYSFSYATNTYRMINCTNYTTYNSLLNYRNIDLDIQPLQGKLLSWMSPTTLYIANLSAFPIYTLISTYSLNTILSLTNAKVFSCKFINQTYVILNTNGSIYQYDFIANTLINRYILPVGKWQQLAFSIGLQAIVGYADGGNITDFYILDCLYRCTSGGPNCACPTFYTLDSAYNFCQKLSLQCAINQTILRQYMNLSSLVNQTYGFVIPLNYSELFNNMSNQTIPLNMSTQSSGQSLYSFIFQSQAAAVVTETISKTLTFSSFRIFPKSWLSFACFFDDFQYYQYHNTTYPIVMQSFLTKINFAEYLRYMPWFLNLFNTFQQQFGQDNLFTTQNQIYYGHSGFSGNNPKNVYFLNVTQDTYKSNLLSNIIIFTLLKMLHGLLYICRNKWVRIQKLYIQIKRQTKWWTFIIAMLQSNMAQLTFQCFLQFAIPSYFNLYNKLNFMAMLLLLFLLLFYAFNFYLLIYKFYHKQSKIILTRSKKIYKSFLFQPCYIVIRGFIRSLIHGFFLKNYRMQIILLFAADIPFNFLAIKMRNFFINKFTFLFSLLYSISFTVFDFYFVLQGYVKIIDRQMFAFVLIMIIIGFCLLISFSIMIPEIYRFFLSIIKYFKRNKIEMEIKLKKQRVKQRKQSLQPKQIEIDQDISQKNPKEKINKQNNYNITNKNQHKLKSDKQKNIIDQNRPLIRVKRKISQKIDNKTIEQKIKNNQNSQNLTIPKKTKKNIYIKKSKQQSYDDSHLKIKSTNNIPINNQKTTIQSKQPLKNKSLKDIPKTQNTGKRIKITMRIVKNKQFHKD